VCQSSSFTIGRPGVVSQEVFSSRIGHASASPVVPTYSDGDNAVQDELHVHLTIISDDQVSAHDDIRHTFG
jgi:hypothetical protein